MPPRPTLCDHLAAISELPEPDVRTCGECLQMRDRWVHLRLCLTCGHVACCDSSKNRHASAHHAATGHPVMRSIEPGERWLWCFVDAETTDL